MITEQQYKALRSIGCEYTYPDIDKAIRWMREVNGVMVLATPVNLWQQWRMQLYVNSYPPQKHRIPAKPTDFDSHDLAQSAGLDAAIEYLKKQKL